jgi:hypothetical protein
MKKIYVTLLVLLITNFQLKSQSALKVTDVNGNVITNTTLNLSVDYFDQISYIMDVENTGTTSKSIKMKKNIVSDLSGSNITMCTGTNCLSPNTLVTPTAVSLNPNTTLLSINQEYHAVFQPFGNLGSATVKYTIFEDGGTDSVFVLFNFSSQVLSIKNVNTFKNLNIKFSEKQLHIDNESAKDFSLEVFDLTGKKIEGINNSNAVSTSLNLPSNQIYLIRYKVDNKTYTKKISAN